MLQIMKFVAAITAFVLFASAHAVAGEEPCRPLTFDEQRFTVCEIDPERHELVLYSADDSGAPYAGFARLPKEREGAPLVFAMNAGMYHSDLSPVGLHIEDGEELQRASTKPGPGNFHLLPNGVFYLDEGRAGVATTQDFIARRISPELATQSGPMLVIKGDLHPRFLESSDSYRRRNGVGVREDGAIVFAISDGLVNFHHFARLFRDELSIETALYFDGTMSSLYAPNLGRADAIRPMG
ncbi:MAG TPA: phosphodiester glycosidase family protein, partial [Saliniramus sp.]|nr:phosphodiester glycosidase family protein [Saliniramus sp.]